MVFEEIQARLAGLVPGVARGEFTRTLTEVDLIADTDVATGKFNLLGTGFVCPAQQEYWVGQGTPNQPMNQGYAYFLLKDAAGVELTGKIRVAIYTANDVLKGIVFEEEGEVLHGSISDRQLKQALPVNRDIKAGKDDYIAVLFKPDVAATVSLTATLILLPVTNRWVPT